MGGPSDYYDPQQYLIKSAFDTNKKTESIRRCYKKSGAGWFTEVLPNGGTSFTPFSELGEQLAIREGKDACSLYTSGTTWKCQGDKGAKGPTILVHPNGMTMEQELRALATYAGVTVLLLALGYYLKRRFCTAKH